MEMNLSEIINPKTGLVRADIMGNLVEAYYDGVMYCVKVQRFVQRQKDIENGYV